MNDIRRINQFPDFNAFASLFLIVFNSMKNLYPSIIIEGTYDLHFTNELHNCICHYQIQFFQHLGLRLHQGKLLQRLTGLLNSSDFRQVLQRADHPQPPPLQQPPQRLRKHLRERELHQQWRLHEWGGVHRMLRGNRPRQSVTEREQHLRKHRQSLSVAFDRVDSLDEPVQRNHEPNIQQRPREHPV